MDIREHFVSSEFELVTSIKASIKAWVNIIVILSSKSYTNISVVIL